MVQLNANENKFAAGRFKQPPWNEESPEWQEIEQFLEPNDLARRIDRGVDGLDLWCLLCLYKGHGKYPYRPDLLLKVVLYEIRRGCPSPTQWHEDLRHHKVVQWLARGMIPSLSQLYNFRDRVGVLVDQWNAQILHEAVEAGWTDAATGCQDGTFIAANASRHRKVKEETLGRHLDQLMEAIAADEQGQEPAERPAWMAKTPEGRQHQWKRHQQARERMEELQEKNQRRRSDKRKKRDEICVSVSDPEAVFGRDKERVYRPLYNVQLINDMKSPFVLGYDVFAQVSDTGTLPPMYERVLDLTGCKLEEVVSDSAYATPRDLEFCDLSGLILYAPWQENDHTAQKKAKQSPSQIPKQAFKWIPEEQVYGCPQGHALRFDSRTSKQRSSGETVKLEIYRCDPEHCLTCLLQRECTSVPEKGRTVRRHEQQDLIDELCQRMQTPEAKALYARRGATAERPYADMKERRNVRRFSGRGLRRAKIQIGLTVLAHNLLTALASAENRNGEQIAANPCKIAA
jgi:transposase